MLLKKQSSIMLMKRHIKCFLLPTRDPTDWLTDGATLGFIAALIQMIAGVGFESLQVDVVNNDNVDIFLSKSFKPGMDAPPRGEPYSRGRGGSPPRPTLWGGGGSPPPPRPVKKIKTAGKLRGKIKARISVFSNGGNK